MGIKITVPEVFARDHWNRGCMDTDKTWKELVIERKSNRVTLVLTEEQIKELHDDANYYATSESHRDMLGLVSSARAVRNAIAKQQPEIVNN
jgi:hypothetical protein